MAYYVTLRIQRRAGESYNAFNRQLEAFMSVRVTVSAALMLLVLPMEQSGAQRRTQSGVSRDTSARTDSSVVPPITKRQCVYETFATRTLFGAAFGLIAKVPLPPSFEVSLSELPVSTTVIATTIIGAAIGAYEAKRDCISRKPPRYRPIMGRV
jgi:hypothetical protein